MEHGFSGFLSNVGDVDDMARNAVKILESIETLEQYKENAFETAKKFDLEIILLKYEAIYHKAQEGILSTHKFDI